MRHSLLLLLLSSLTLASEAVAEDPRPSAVAPAPELATAPSLGMLRSQLADRPALERARALLDFALAHPRADGSSEAVEEARRLLAEVAPGSAEDRVAAGLLALLSAEEPEARRSHVASLVGLRDPRAVPPLAFLARRDAALSVRREALVGLGLLPSPAAESATRNFLRDRREPGELRSLAAQSLAAMGTPSAAETLMQVASDGEEQDSLRAAAFAALEAHYPAVAESMAGRPQLSDSGGRVALAVVGSLSGGYTLGMIGSLSPNPALATSVGVPGGLLIGAASGYLLAGSSGVTSPQALYVGSAAAWSVPAGWLFGASLGGGDLPTAQGLALLTHVAAVGGAWGTRDLLPLSTGDVIEINQAAASALALTAGGLLLLPSSADQRPAMGVLGLAPLVGLAAGTALSPVLHGQGPNLPLSLLMGAQGFYSGRMLADSFVPVGSFNPRVEASGLLGLGAGLAGGLALSTVWQPSASDVAVVLAGALMGDFLGAGMPLVAQGDRNGKLAAGLSGALGLAGAVGLGLLIEPMQLELGSGDFLLLSLTSAFLGGQGWGWGSFAGLESSRVGGLALMGLGLGTAGILFASQRLEITPWQAAWLFSGAAWGAWFAGLGTVGLGLTGDGRALLGASLVGMNVGLLTTGLLLSPLVRLPPDALAWASVGGVGGSAVGALVGVFSGSGAETVAMVSLLGSGVGLAVGAGLWASLNAANPAGATRPTVTAGGPGITVPWPAHVSVSPILSTNGRETTGMRTDLVWSLP